MQTPTFFRDFNSILCGLGLRPLCAYSKWPPIKKKMDTTSCNTGLSIPWWVPGFENAYENSREKSLNYFQILYTEKKQNTAPCKYNHPLEKNAQLFSSPVLHSLKALFLVFSLTLLLAVSLPQLTFSNQIFSFFSHLHIANATVHWFSVCD